MYGHFQILQWLKINGSPCSKETFENAILMLNLENLKVVNARNQTEDLWRTENIIRLFQILLDILDIYVLRSN